MRPVHARIVFLFLGVAVLAQAQQYVISTFAGGAPPPTPVLGVEMPIAPQSVATDASGNTYFIASHCVFKLDPTGLVTRIAGNGKPGYSGDGRPAIGAQLLLQSVSSPGPFVYVGAGTLPPAIAADNAGNVYVADNGNYRVRRISSDGIITTIAGNGTAGFSGDGGPATDAQLSAVFGLALDVAGNLLIADSSANRIRRITPDGIITTIAGAGDSGLSGDGGPAAAAQLRNPAGIAVDTGGNLFIADLGNARIRRVTTDGNITTVAGAGPLPPVSPGVNECQPSGDGGPAAGAVLCLPINVTVDRAGDVFVADVYANADYYFAPSVQVVREISPDGVITAVAGFNCLVGYPSFCYNTTGYGTTAPLTMFQGPLALAVDNNGNLILSDDSANQIGLLPAPAGHVYKVSPGGKITSLVGSGQVSFFSGDGGPAVSAQLRNPHGVASDSNGNVFIADSGNYRIRKVSSDGTITTVAGNGTGGSSGDGGPAANSQATPSNLAVDGLGNLFLFDISGKSIRKVSRDGIISTVTAIGSAGGYYNDLVAADGSGNLFAACSTGVLNSVCQISPSGAIRTVAGNGTWGFSGDGGPATSAQLAFPKGAALDGAGNLFIADTFNHRIRKVTPDGTITTIAGSGATNPMLSSNTPEIPGGFSGDGGPAIDAQLSFPTDLVLDGAGNLFFTDSGNNRVRKISPSGIITTIAGDATPGYSGDGGLATRASFSGPVALAGGGAGNVYVADFGNNAIRILQPVPTHRGMPRD